MNIDWSKAPEGADRYYPEDLEMGWSESWGKGNKIWHLSCWFDPIHFGGLHKKRLNSCIMRPINSAQQWAGEGLPPVGTVCEINGTVYEELRGKEFSWRKVEIIAHTNFGGDDVAVGRDLECATLGWGIAKKFRPIRTPEQNAAEEREKAVQQMAEDVGHLNSRDTAIKVLYAIYDAGYRKQEQTK